MFCPSCGKENPEGRKYCKYCGSAIDGPRQEINFNWIYQAYVYQFPNNVRGISVGLGFNEYLKIKARIKFWNEYQSIINKEIQVFIDQGWEPVGVAGPLCIDIKIYNVFPGKAAKPVDFRLAMRTQKNNIDGTKTSLQIKGSTQFL